MDVETELTVLVTWPRTARASFVQAVREVWTMLFVEPARQLHALTRRQGD
jgi:hypothetical protein